MKLLTATLAAVLLAAPSAKYGEIYAGMPPQRFQGDGYGIVAYVSDVSVYCGKREGVTIFACVREIDGVRVTYLPNPCRYGPQEWFANLACHENAHAHHRWPGNHPL